MCLVEGGCGRVEVVGVVSGGWADLFSGRGGVAGGRGNVSGGRGDMSIALTSW